MSIVPCYAVRYHGGSVFLRLPCTGDCLLCRLPNQNPTWASSVGNLLYVLRLSTRKVPTQAKTTDFLNTEVYTTLPSFFAGSDPTWKRSPYRNTQCQCNSPSPIHYEQNTELSPEPTSPGSIRPSLCRNTVSGNVTLSESLTNDPGPKERLGKKMQSAACHGTTSFANNFSLSTSFFPVTAPTDNRR